MTTQRRDALDRHTTSFAVRAPATAAEWDEWRERNRRATAAVRDFAEDEDEAREMLDMLGLLPAQLEEAEKFMRRRTWNAAPRQRRLSSTRTKDPDQ